MMLTALYQVMNSNIILPSQHTANHVLVQC
jgi:hypothetical protein